MLPEPLSTDRTSLNAGENRPAIVVDMLVGADGTPGASDVYHAGVRNKAKLAYREVAAWLDGAGPPPAAAASAEMQRQIGIQSDVAARLRARRQEMGALDFDRTELKPIMDDGRVKELRAESPNRARDMIESFMVAANGVTARFLTSHGWATIRRVVKAPARWPRIVDIAAAHGTTLPVEPDARALEQFLVSRREADPAGFADLSLSVLKLLGRGEYLAVGPGGDEGEHFALAESNYTHSTAPNRRFPDLITQRLVKAALEKARAPYSLSELGTLAAHCTKQEDAANKVERRVRKSAAALWLSDRVGQEFDAVVTGASAKGTWVRLDRPPVEGKLERGAEGLDVGDRVRVRLVHTDAEKGFVDFARIGR
jgi:exoribonuclease-2